MLMIDGAFLLEFVESPLSKTVPEVYGEIAALLRKAEGGDFLVKSAADLFLVLRKHGLLTDTRLPPMSVGAHPQNRDGLMLNATDVHQLLDSICWPSVKGPLAATV